MPSRYFSIEVYECSFGCPEYGLMGYSDIDELLLDCWDEYNKECDKDDD